MNASKKIMISRHEINYFIKKIPWKITLFCRKLKAPRITMIIRIKSVFVG